MKATVIAASNRAAAGVYEDTTGPVIVAALAEAGFEVTGPVVVPDGEPVGAAIRAALDDAVAISATVRTTDRTGVEMEALTAACAAALTVYDMCKSVDRGMVLQAVQLEHKAGGRSGVWEREPAKPAAGPPRQKRRSPRR